MEKKQHITEQDVRSYFKENGIDEEQLFSYHRLTLDGDQRLLEVIKHFTAATLEGKSITIDLDDETKIVSGEFDEDFYSKETTDNIDSLLGSMNKIIDFHNFCLEQIEPTKGVYDAMSKDERERTEGIMKRAQAKIDELNALQRPFEMNDFKEDTIEPLLEMRQASRDIVRKGDRAQHLTEDHYALKTRIEAFLKVRGWDFDKLFDQKRSYKQRKEKMNEVLREFAYTYVNEQNDIVTIDPAGNEHKVTDVGEFSLKSINNENQFVYMTNGCRENRDLSFFVGSPFVQKNKALESDLVERTVKDNWGISLQDVIDGKGKYADKESRIDALNELHFYLTEVHRDDDMDLVTPFSKDQGVTMKITGIGDPETYFDNIDSVDTFMEKAKKARMVRDALNADQERLSEIVKEKFERLKKERGDEELER